MQIGTDIFKWLRLAIIIIKAIAQIFGDDDDKEEANNGNLDV